MTDCYTCGCDIKHKAHGLCMYHYNRSEWCKKNRTEYFKKYYQTLKGKIAITKAIRKYENKNLDRRSTWRKAGNKIKLEPCIRCGKSLSHRYHPDITKPLDIIFLCALHHKQEHRAII